MTTATGQTIALCMIVRDEAEVIERCLDSARPVIDSWMVVDAGSQDGTPELIERLLADLPGQLYRRAWRDFGANRSELMRLAAGAADYLLLLDADMTLEQSGPVPRLRADAYGLRQRGERSCIVPRLLRGDRRWWFEGSVHERLTGDRQPSYEVLDALAVTHRERSDRLTSELALLERDLDRDPDDARTIFYLAETLRRLGERERAIEMYERRLALEGADEEEERFYAAYQKGSLLAAAGDDRAAGALFGAWQFRPQRAEPLYDLARWCRMRRWRQTGYVYASRGVQIPRPDDELFVHDQIYAYGLRFEVAVAAYWLERYDEALVLCDELLEDGLPPEVEQAVRDVRSYSLDRARGPTATRRRVPLLSDSAPSLSLAEIKLDVPPGSAHLNPSIGSDGESFRMIVRSIADGGQAIDHLIALDGQLTITSVGPLDDRSGGPGGHFELLQPISVGGEWFALAPTRGRQMLLSLEGNEIARATALQGTPAANRERRWLPFTAGALPHFMYRCTPPAVLRGDPVSGRCQLVAEQAMPRTPQLRGGSQGSEVEDGVLFVVHGVAWSGGQRTHQHRFVLLDEEFELAGMSAPFHFVGPGIELCTGLARRDDDLVLTFGVEGRSAKLGVVGLDEVLDMVEPVTHRLATA